MKPTLAKFAAAALLLVPLAVSVRRSNGDITSPSRRAQLVNLARVINTAQMIYRRQQGRYASWSELRESTGLRDAQQRVARPGVAALPSFDAIGQSSLGMSLDLVANGSDGYQFRVTDENDKACRQSAFSDEKGLIFEGSVIGCKAH